MRLVPLLLGLVVFCTFPAFARNETSVTCEPNLTAPATFTGEVDYPDYPELPQMYQKALSLIHDQSHPLLTVVVPAYKEELRIGESIGEIRRFFDRYPFPVEVLVRIEKSPDRTAEVASAAAQGDPRIVISAHDVQRGKGFAVRQGMLAAKGDYVVFTDTDLSTPLPEIFRFLSLIADGDTSDVLIGDRRHPQSNVETKQTVARRVMGATFQALIRSVLSSNGLRGIHDTQCGFKMFKARANQTLFSLAQVDGFAFDIEVLMMAAQLGFKISAIPITWKNDPRSTVRPIRDPIKMAVDVIKMRAQVQKDIKQGLPSKVTPVYP